MADRSMNHGPRSIRPEDLPRLTDMWNRGVPVNTMARLLDCPVGVVRYWRKKLGLPNRKEGHTETTPCVVILRLSREDYNRFKREATRRGYSMAALIRERIDFS